MRRGGAAALALAGAFGSPGGALAQAPAAAPAAARQRAAFELRRDAAQAHLAAPPPAHATNGDEERYADKRASFAKTLPHNELGEVDAEAYATFRAILERGDPAAFAGMPRAPSARLRLSDPQSAYAYDLVSVDPAATRLAPPPAFASAEAAAEMAELYWQQLTLDVPYRGYDSHALARAATAELGRLMGPSHGSGAGLFRGETAGDGIGPYISQFLWNEIPYGGMATIEQRYRFPARGQSFLTDWASWLACQRGEMPTAQIRLDGTPRYISSARELAAYVHRDFLYQPYLNAALVMLRLGDEALSPTNPYRGSRTATGDITFGAKHVLSMLGHAAQLSQKGAWYHKWLVHRRLRPEVLGARVDAHLAGRKSYDLHADLLRSDAVAHMRATNGTALLPVTYPEGSPTHPSYPAGHTTCAGACATMLKAFFDESYVLREPVEAAADGAALEPWRGAPLTLGHEIDKLASNITIGRDAGGVHYRSDGIQGMLLGEDMAIGLLQDYSRTFHERFDGFVLTRFDGRRVRIAGGRVI
jgi:hypothetical protein